MIKLEVNAGHFLKSILNVAHFTRNFKCRHYFMNSGDSGKIPGNWNIWPEMQWKKIFTLTPSTVFRYPFHCKYRELIYFLLHCPLSSIFHILFLEAATENYLLKYVFPENKQNRLKVAGNKPFPK